MLNHLWQVLSKWALLSDRQDESNKCQHVSEFGLMTRSRKGRDTRLLLFFMYNCPNAVKGMRLPIEGSFIQIIQQYKTKLTYITVDKNAESSWAVSWILPVQFHSENLLSQFCVQLFSFIIHLLCWHQREPVVREILKCICFEAATWNKYSDQSKLDPNPGCVLVPSKCPTK